MCNGNLIAYVLEHDLDVDIFYFAPIPLTQIEYPCVVDCKEAYFSSFV